MGGWTGGTKSVRDKAVLSRPQTPSRNAGRGCGFERISTAFPYLFGGSDAITFMAVLSNLISAGWEMPQSQRFPRFQMCYHAQFCEMEVFLNDR